jgi:hypothetical protein
MARRIAATAMVLALASVAAAQEEDHSHPPPERLGHVHFATSCAATAGS